MRVGGRFYRQPALPDVSTTPVVQPRVVERYEAGRRPERAPHELSTVRISFELSVNAAVSESARITKGFETLGARLETAAVRALLETLPN